MGKTLHVSSDKNVLKKNFVSFEERKRQIQEEEKQEKEEQERRKKSPFRDFVQLNKETWKAEDWLMAKSPIAYRIFRFLMNHMDPYNAVVCSQRVLQETFNVSRVTISTAVKLLKEKGYLYVYKSGTTNVYAINDKIAWNSWGTNYAYSKFPANVLLSLSEQEKREREKIKAAKHKEIVIDNSSSQQ